MRDGTSERKPPGLKTDMNSTSLLKHPLFTVGVGNKIITIAGLQMHPILFQSEKTHSGT